MLRRSRPIVRLAWTAGEVFHHRLPDGLRRVQSPPVPNERDVEAAWESPEFDAGSSFPTYPYRPLPFEPIRLSPAPSIRNPVLTRRDVTDYGRVEYVADPFLFVTSDGDWHMFFEIYNSARSPDAVIGHATSPNGGHTWNYDRVVLKTDFHISFPYVFKWNGTYYLIPEVGRPPGETRVILYEATEFPTDWTETAELITPGHRTDDAIVFRWNDRWWMLVGDGTTDGVYAYHSTGLRSPDWSAHERNPVVSNRPKAGRPAGRPIVSEDRVLVYYQDSVRTYGHKVRAYAIDELTPDTYRDTELSASPVLESSDSALGWNSGRMHHIDPWYNGSEWVCAVDGNIGSGSAVFTGRHWGIGMYVATAPSDL